MVTAVAAADAACAAVYTFKQENKFPSLECFLFTQLALMLSFEIVLSLDLN